jgi:hypothetical protein
MADEQACAAQELVAKLYVLVPVTSAREEQAACFHVKSVRVGLNIPSTLTKIVEKEARVHDRAQTRELARNWVHLSQAMEAFDKKVHLPQTMEAFDK